MDNSKQASVIPAPKVPGNDEVVVEVDPTSSQSANGRITDEHEIVKEIPQRRIHLRKPPLTPITKAGVRPRP